MINWSIGIRRIPVQPHFISFQCWGSPRLIPCWSIICNSRSATAVCSDAVKCKWMRGGRNADQVDQKLSNCQVRRMPTVSHDILIRRAIAVIIWHWLINYSESVKSPDFGHVASLPPPPRLKDAISLAAKLKVQRFAERQGRRRGWRTGQGDGVNTG